MENSTGRMHRDHRAIGLHIGAVDRAKLGLADGQWSLHAAGQPTPAKGPALPVSISDFTFRGYVLSLEPTVSQREKCEAVPP